MLTQKQVDTLRPDGTRQMLHDRDGLYLRITPTGRKKWIVRAYHNGHEHIQVIGEPPFMSLAEARIARYDLKRADHQCSTRTFGQIARQYITNHGADRSPSTHYQYETHLRRLAGLQEVPVRSLTRSMLADVMLGIAKVSTIGNAQRSARFASAVLDYAVDLGLLEHSPAQRLARILPATKTAHYPAVTTEAGAAELFRALDQIDFYSARYCIKFIALTAVRSGEARGARWEEIDFDSRLWQIPAERTKKRRPHVVPLSTQACILLQRLRPFVAGPYVFPASRSANPITNGRLNFALQTLQRLQAPPPICTVHGFRATASTLLHESGLWPHEVIEAQLAHLFQSVTSSAYNRTLYLPQRRDMLQWWADHCCSLGLII